MGMNLFALSGEIKSVQLFDKNPEKASAVILVQYGPSRERGNRPVEFINACRIRVPPYRYAKIKHRLKVGEFVDITGRIQGILKMSLGEGTLGTEHVAEHLEFEDAYGPDDSVEDDAAGHAATVD